MFNIEVFQIKSAIEFLDLCGKSLYAHEAEYSLMLGLAEVASRKEDPSGNFYCVKDGQQIIGSGYVTEKNLILSSMPKEAVRALADQMYFDKMHVPGVVGPVKVIELFAKYWAGVTEQKYSVAMSQKIYKLEKVIPAKAVAGKIHVAGPEYEELVRDWVYAFSVESLPPHEAVPEAAALFAKNKIERKEIFLWLDENGKPVCMNASGRPTKNGTSISAVYTPKELRGRGYASALVATTSQVILDQGKKFCMLYTDLSNPTSNKIYQNIGYNEIATSAHYIFT